MNLQLKAVYVCVTNQHRWGKGYTIKEAKNNAGITKQTENHNEFYVMAALFDNPTDEELKNLFMCITADQISGSPVYYQDDRTQADTDMINAKHVGWLTVEKNY